MVEAWPVMPSSGRQNTATVIGRLFRHIFPMNEGALFIPQALPRSKMKASRRFLSTKKKNYKFP